jgi:Spa2 Homology Domain (SHD)-containing protein
MSRFKDLSSDVYYELVRRYPEFKEEVNLICPPPPTLFLRTFFPSNLLMPL